MQQPPGAGIPRRRPSLPPLPAALLLTCLLGGGCGPRQGEPPQGLPPPATDAPGAPHPSAAAAPSGPAPRAASPRQQPWAGVTVSPRPAAPGDPALGEWLSLCGDGDAALHEVARAVALHRDRRGAPPDLEWTTYRLRQHGAPYVAPRVWSAELPPAGRAPQDEVAGRVEERVEERVEGWARRTAHGRLRCGIAEVAREDGSRIVALVQVDAQGDLMALPTRAAPGEWLEVVVRPLVAVTDVAGLALGPRGSPRPIVLRQEGDEWRGRFAVGEPGTWVLQMLANREGGALPILEAHVRSGDAPVAEPWTLAAPGETARASGMQEEEALLAMLNEARRLTGLAPLTLSRPLSTLARRHAAALRSRGEITHDAGVGNPTRRIEEAGIDARQVGENVARAPSTLRIYRALWASPSHRANLLFPHFDKVGIGVSWEGRDMMYVSLLFVDDG